MPMSYNRIGAVQGSSIFQIILYWLIAPLAFAQLIFGESMTKSIEAAKEGKTLSRLDANLSGAHQYFGITIVALVAVLLALPVRNGVLTPPVSGGAMELAGHLSHWLLCALLTTFLLIPFDRLFKTGA